MNPIVYCHKHKLKNKQTKTNTVHSRVLMKTNKLSYRRMYWWYPVILHISTCWVQISSHQLERLWQSPVDFWTHDKKTNKTNESKKKMWIQFPTHLRRLMRARHLTFHTLKLKLLKCTTVELLPGTKTTRISTYH